MRIRMMLRPADNDVIFIAQWHSEVGRIIIYAKRKAKYKGKGERKPLLNLVANFGKCIYFSK